MKEYYDWLLRQTWPLPIVPLLFGLYFVLQAVFVGKGAGVNTWYGTALQILGGIQILWSIDKNLREFNKKNLWASMMAWVGSHPGKRSIPGVAILALDGVKVIGSATVSVKRNRNSIEERVKYLEEEVSRVQEDLSKGLSALQSKMDDQRREFQAAMADGSKKVSQLHELVHEVVVGDVKVQLTGLLVVIMGTIFASLG